MPCGLCGHIRSRAAVAYRARTRTSHFVVTGRRGLRLVERCFTNCANKTALGRAQVGIKALQSFCRSAGQGRGLEKSAMPARLPAATGVSIPWASVSLTIKGNKAPAPSTRLRAWPRVLCRILYVHGGENFVSFMWTGVLLACVLVHHMRAGVQGGRRTGC